MPVTPGCTEHHCKLTSVLAEARKTYKSQAVCLLDWQMLMGVFIIHSLNIPLSIIMLPQFCNILEAFYAQLCQTNCTVINALVVTLLDLGLLPSALQCADDTWEQLSFLTDLVDRWLRWSVMKANVIVLLFKGQLGNLLILFCQ